MAYHIIDICEVRDPGTNDLIERIVAYRLEDTGHKFRMNVFDPLDPPGPVTVPEIQVAIEAYLVQFRRGDFDRAPPPVKPPPPTITRQDVNETFDE